MRTIRTIGIDIGGTKCAVTLGEISESEEVTFLAKRKFATDHQPPYTVLQRFLEETQACLEEVGMTYRDIDAIGVSCGGPLDAKKGLVLCPPSLPDWDRIPVTDFFTQHTGLPCFLQNDANACAVAEWKFGAGKGCDNLIFITFGTGFGAGLILNGALYSGASDMAGEIGHVRIAEDGPFWYGKNGAVEGFCSGGSLGRAGQTAASRQLEETGASPLLERAGSLEAIDARLIADMAEEGDPLCQTIYRECGVKLGQALAMLIDVINPEKIIIGGVFARRTSLLLPPALEVIQKESLKEASCVCQVVPCGLGEKVGDYAAISVAYSCLAKRHDQNDTDSAAIAPCDVTAASCFSSEGFKPSTLAILDELGERYPALQPDVVPELLRGFSLLWNTYTHGGKLLVCGNGGSCADSEHIVGELMKSFRCPRPLSPELTTSLTAMGPEGEKLASSLEKAYPAIALTSHPALTTAFSNDAEGVYGFAQQLSGLGTAGDVLMTISTSGNSKNCVYAAMTAKAMGIPVISLTGASGGKLKELSAVCLRVPETETYKIQEYHLPLYHCLCAMVENEGCSAAK